MLTAILLFVEPLEDCWWKNTRSGVVPTSCFRTHKEWESQSTRNKTKEYKTLRPGFLISIQPLANDLSSYWRFPPQTLLFPWHQRLGFLFSCDNYGCQDSFAILHCFFLTAHGRPGFPWRGTRTSGALGGL